MNTTKKEKLIALSDIKNIKGDVVGVEVKRRKSALYNLARDSNDYVLSSLSKVIMIGDGEEVKKYNLEVNDIVMLHDMGTNILTTLPIYATHDIVEIENYVENNEDKQKEIVFEVGIAILPVYNIVMTLNKSVID